MADKSTGNIILISKKYMENGEGISWNATGNTSLNAATMVRMTGKDGIRFADYQPGSKQPLLVEKVEGPFDEDGQPAKEMLIGKWYGFKATAFSRQASEQELSQIKWAIQFDEDKIKYLEQNTTVKNGIVGVLCKVADETTAKKARFYGYFQQPTKAASTTADVKPIEPVIVFVNGYWNVRMPFAGTESGKNYWGNDFVAAARQYFKSTKLLYINGADTMFSAGTRRFSAGKKIAQDRFKNTQSDFYKQIFKEKGDDGKYLTPVCLVSHSMGAAYAEGIASVLKEKGVRVIKVAHFSPADVSEFSATFPDRTFQIDIDVDPVLMFKNLNDRSFIAGVKGAAKVKNPQKDVFGHMHTKVSGYVWKWLEDLETIHLGYIGETNHMQYVPALGLGGGTIITTKVKTYRATNNKNSTQFMYLRKDGKFYTHKNGNDYFL